MASAILACRSMDKAKQAMGVSLDEVPDAGAMALPLDVSEPESIAAFCADFVSQVGQLDLLINDAGVVFAPLERNSLGHELHLATRCLGPLALTGTLLPFFRETRRAQLACVGSLADRLAKLDLDGPNRKTTRFGEWRAFGRSKLALQTAIPRSASRASSWLSSSPRASWGFPRTPVPVFSFWRGGRATARLRALRCPVRWRTRSPTKRASPSPSPRARR